MSQDGRSQCALNMGAMEECHENNRFDEDNHSQTVAKSPKPCENVSP